MRVARYTRQGADPCGMTILRQQAEYSVKRAELCCIAAGALSKRRDARGANGSAPSAARCQLRALPTKAFLEAPMSRYQRLKIEGGAFLYTLALADRGGDRLAASVSAWARSLSSGRPLRARPVVLTLAIEVPIGRLQIWKRRGATTIRTLARAPVLCLSPSTAEFHVSPGSRHLPPSPSQSHRRRYRRHHRRYDSR
jgi:hypothetical protein